MLKPSSGKIIINDKQNILNNLDKWHEKISYIPQKPYFFDDNIVKNIAVGINSDEIDFKKIDKCLEIVNLKKKNLYS